MLACVTERIRIKYGKMQNAQGDRTECFKMKKIFLQVRTTVYKNALQLQTFWIKQLVLLHVQSVARLLLVALQLTLQR